jgi:Putative 2OG-Fe(II) oxygenase
MQLTEILFRNLNVFMVDVPQDLLTELNDQALLIQKDWSKHRNGNAQLAGHIDHQYAIRPRIPNLDNFVLSLANVYNHKFNLLNEYYNNNTHQQKFIAGESWMNFQAATDYNPVHDHSGILSWTIWLKIPYDRDKEAAHFPNREKHRILNGSFQFFYTDAFGKISDHTIDLDSTYEGKLIMFPSKMKHTVYPFYTTDEYRISVAGNILTTHDPEGAYIFFERGLDE